MYIMEAHSLLLKVFIQLLPSRNIRIPRMHYRAIRKVLKEQYVFFSTPEVLCYYRVNVEDNMDGKTEANNLFYSVMRNRFTM